MTNVLYKKSAAEQVTEVIEEMAGVDLDPKQMPLTRQPLHRTIQRCQEATEVGAGAAVHFTGARPKEVLEEEVPGNLIIYSRMVI